MDENSLVLLFVYPLQENVVVVVVAAAVVDDENEN